MRGLIKGKEALIRFYSRNDTYLTAAVKFAIAFLALFYVRENGGIIEPLDQLTVILIIAAFCSFLPSNALLLAGAVYLTAQFYLCSLEAAIVGGTVVLILLLFYFCFIPGQTYVVVLTALCIGWRLPFAVPLVCALLMGPGALVGIICGGAAYTLAQYLHESGPGAEGSGEDFFNHILVLFQGLLRQQQLLAVLVILTASFLVVYLIRRMPVQYSWKIAIVSGMLVYGLLSGMSMILLDTELSSVNLAADLLIGAAAGMLVQFFCFSLDYKKVEYLQFEDDDYYYYVKAVSKLRSNVDDGDCEEGDYIE